VAASDDPFVALLARARQGDEAALLEIARRYEPEVRLVARLRLGPALRPYLDSLDLVQSVHRSLMLGIRQQKYDIVRAEQLVALALTMVRRKAARAWRRARRQQRETGAPGDRLAGLLAELSSPAPDPSQTAAYRDTIDAVCRELTPSEKQLLEMHLEGYATVEIAAELSQNADVLRVKLSRLRAKLRQNGVLADGL
jgi:RNA polymerase sigma-70 factor (ECF subfamily)